MRPLKQLQRRKAFGVEGLRPAEAPAILNIRLGALYRIGAARGFGRETLAKLMVTRAGLKHKAAEQLAEHWLGTEPFRKQRP